MGVDIYALVTQWEPMVAAFRESDGLDFFWDSGEEDLPYATDFSGVPGRTLLAVGEYYEELRLHLPAAVRESADALFSLIAWDDEPLPDDLSVDTGVEHAGAVLFAMRPATVRNTVALAEAVDWDALTKYSDLLGEVTVSTTRHRTLDSSQFQWMAEVHVSWLRKAAEAGNGLVVIVSW